MSEEGARLLRRMVAGAVHDLRHPVTVIEGQRRLLEEGLLGALTPAMHEAVLALERQTVRMTRILQEVEAASRQESGPVCEFDLADLFAEQWSDLFDSPPPRLARGVLEGDRAACAALVAEVLAYVGSGVVVVLDTVGPSSVVLTVRGPIIDRLDALTADVLWCSRVTARRHGGHVTISGRGGSSAELRVQLATGSGTRRVPQ